MGESLNGGRGTDLDDGGHSLRGAWLPPANVGRRRAPSAARRGRRHLGHRVSPPRHGSCWSNGGSASPASVQSTGTMRQPPSGVCNSNCRLPLSAGVPARRQGPRAPALRRCARPALISTRTPASSFPNSALDCHWPRHGRQRLRAAAGVARRLSAGARRSWAPVVGPVLVQPALHGTGGDAERFPAGGPLDVLEVQRVGRTRRAYRAPPHPLARGPRSRAAILFVGHDEIPPAFACVRDFLYSSSLDFPIAWVAGVFGFYRRGGLAGVWVGVVAA